MKNLRELGPRASIAVGLFLLFSPIVYAHSISLDIIESIESSGNPKAESFCCRGLYQISKITLRQFNQDRNKAYSFDDLFNPSINREIAEYYFNWLDERLDNERDILIAYNFGIGNLRKYQRGEIDLPTETVNYLKKYAGVDNGGTL